MQDFEKLGVFYLGRTYDSAAAKPGQDLLLYDSRDLVTHAVCFGMTGSGKTGLCLSLLEEAAIDGVPCIAIDPKGDIANLLLTFPDLNAESFRPWINEDEARTKGVAPDAYAEQQAALWKKGLGEWGQDGDRIRRMRDACDFAVYTPGSSSGLPVSILRSFAAPPDAILEDAELLRERVGGAASALLGLLGIDADPVQSREHILLSTIFASAWKQSRDLDLAAVIQAVQSPPVARIGVLDVEAFFPSKDRFALAMQLNNLLASPGFEAWLSGEPLDPEALLHTPQGKPRISIFSIAHLSDAERMFFVSLLLTQTLSWMRTQAGTTSLRAILYMDEIFGYFPPVANPPSKQPLLTLLKQARAYGLGVVLATQNPVDLDYKGLSNCGTWFIGRLQTDRDRARVLDGLEGAGNGAFNRQAMERTLGQLGNRVFLMNNVHEDAPVVFQSRWAMSYLRGPLTRAQVKTLMSGRLASTPVAAPPSPAAAAVRPVLPPEVQQYFVPVRGDAAGAVYQPQLIGAAQVRFTDTKTKVDLVRDITVLAGIGTGAVPVDWSAATEAENGVDELEREPAEGARFGELPGAASVAKNYAAWNKSFAAWLYGSQTLTLFKSPSSGEISQPDESERNFRVRLQQAGREERDACVEKLRRTYAPKIAALQERIRRAEQAEERERQQASEQKLQAVVSIGTSLLGALMGRKALSATNLSRASSAVRAGTKTWKEAQDVGRAEENTAALQQQLQALSAQCDEEIRQMEASASPTTEALETIVIKLKKTNINVRLVALCWVPDGQ